MNFLLKTFLIILLCTPSFFQQNNLMGQPNCFVGDVCMTGPVSLENGAGYSVSVSDISIENVVSIIVEVEVRGPRIVNHPSLSVVSDDFPGMGATLNTQISTGAGQVRYQFVWQDFANPIGIVDDTELFTFFFTGLPNECYFVDYFTFSRILFLDDTGLPTPCQLNNLCAPSEVCFEGIEVGGNVFREGGDCSTSDGENGVSPT